MPLAAAAAPARCRCGSAVLASVVGGAVLDLAYPDVGWWPMAFVGVAFALVGAHRALGRGASLLVGFVFGASFFLVHIVWITRYLGVVPWFALSGARGGPHGGRSDPDHPRVSMDAARAARRAGRSSIAAAAARRRACGPLRELFMGSWPYSGLPVGADRHEPVESPLAHIVSWVGCLGAHVPHGRRSRAAAIEWVRAGAVPRRPHRAAGRSVVAAAAPARPRRSRRRRPATLRVGSVQGNGPSGYFDERTRNAVLNAQLEAIRSAVRRGHRRAALARGRHRLRPARERVDGRGARRAVASGSTRR